MTFPKDIDKAPYEIRKFYTESFNRALVDGADEKEADEIARKKLVQKFS